MTYANPQSDKARSNYRKRHLKHFYSMSLEEYDFLLEQQDNHCALCPTTPEQNGRRLFVDHDHSCCPGKISCGECVRGLLCLRCNTVIEWYISLPNKEFLLEYIGDKR